MFIGVDAVLVNRLNACGLTPSVSKVSSGALEFMPLYSVKYMKDFLQNAKRDPYDFKIISTNLDESADTLIEDAPEYNSSESDQEEQVDII